MGLSLQSFCRTTARYLQELSERPLDLDIYEEEIQETTAAAGGRRHMTILLHCTPETTFSGVLPLKFGHWLLFLGSQCFSDLPNNLTFLRKRPLDVSQRRNQWSETHRQPIDPIRVNKEVGLSSDCLNMRVEVTVSCVAPSHEDISRHTHTFHNPSVRRPVTACRLFESDVSCMCVHSHLVQSRDTVRRSVSSQMPQCTHLSLKRTPMRTKTLPACPLTRVTAARWWMASCMCTRGGI